MVHRPCRGCRELKLIVCLEKNTQLIIMILYHFCLHIHVSCSYSIHMTTALFFHTKLKQTPFAYPMVYWKKIKHTWPVLIIVQVTIYRRLLIGRDGHLDQSEAYDIS